MEKRKQNPTPAEKIVGKEEDILAKVAPAANGAREELLDEELDKVAAGHMKPRPGDGDFI